MAGMAIDGEADCALFDRLTRERSDLFNLVWRGLLFDGAFAHHVKAGRAVPDQPTDVDHGA